MSWSPSSFWVKTKSVNYNILQNIRTVSAWKTPAWQRSCFLWRSIYNFNRVELKESEAFSNKDPELTGFVKNSLESMNDKDLKKVRNFRFSQVQKIFRIMQKRFQAASFTSAVNWKGWRRHNSITILNSILMKMPFDRFQISGAGCKQLLWMGIVPLVFFCKKTLEPTKHGSVLTNGVL